MKKINEKLSDIFDVNPIEIKENISTGEIVAINTENSVESDSQFARENIRNLLEKGSTAIDELVSVARDSQHPRAYEVLATMMKNMSDMNKDLLEIQKRKKDLLNISEKAQGDVTIDKAVFVGSTAELMKLINQNK